MKENPCMRMAHLRETLSQGRFTDPVDTFRALDHFTRPCPQCWQRLARLVTDETPINLEALEYRAAENPREPTVALALGRLILAARKPEAADGLAPTHRHLLGQTTWDRKFEFWWLLIEEERRLALASKVRKSQPWQAWGDVLDVDALAPAYVRLTFDADLCLLILAYRVDELRLGGQPRAAEILFVDILAQAHRCRPEIRATIHEIQADILWASSRDPSRVLKHLLQAEELLKETTIPGRRAEIRARIARIRPCQADVESALATFSRALATRVTA